MPFMQRRPDYGGEDVLGARRRRRDLNALVRIHQDHVLNHVVPVVSNAEWVSDDIGRVLVGIPDGDALERRRTVEENKGRAVALAAAAIHLENGPHGSPGIGGPILPIAVKRNPVGDAERALEGVAGRRHKNHTSTQRGDSLNGIRECGRVIGHAVAPWRRNPGVCRPPRRSHSDCIGAG